MASSSRPFLFRVAGIPMSLTRYAARNEDFVLVCARLLSYDGPTAYGSGLTGCARRRAAARERRGALGSPQATEPGCGAEPHVSCQSFCLAPGGGKSTLIKKVLSWTSPFLVAGKKTQLFLTASIARSSRPWP